MALNIRIGRSLSTAAQLSTLSPAIVLWRALWSSGLPLIAMPLDAAAQAPAGEATLPRVEVIGTSPLPGQGVDRDLLPYSTQTIRRQRIDDANSDNLGDFMNRHLPGVQINDVQGSPFQGDLTYRGFRASPLLGAGQGLSVYLDGVRINEPFGDVVNWDTLPEFSVNTLTLVPGANPAFGLNSLGGALSFTTHNGLTAPGVRAEVSAGSFGRKRVDLGYGARHADGWHSYVAGSAFDETGWRDHSAGRLGNLLAKVGRAHGATEWDLSLLLGRSRLVGNGLVPAYTLHEEGGETERTPDLYAARRGSVYTYPDQTRNRLGQLALNLRHALNASTQLSALVYLRNAKRHTVNGDVADDITADSNASFNTSATRQRSEGLALSLSGRAASHQWQVGASLDASRTSYEQFEQEGLFTADRGVQAGDEEPQLSARVTGRSRALGVYATDTWQVAPRTHVTGTVRYNHATLSNVLTSVDDATGDIEQRPNERFSYRRLNPALGIAHRLEAGPTLFANLAQNNRVPTVIELGCADPTEPCRLPAGLQSDPYLKQVVSRTAELGMRWPVNSSLRFALAAYRTDNRDDILFTSVSTTGQVGYFQNFPRTRNQGIDAELQASLGSLQLNFSYSQLQATYQAAGTLRVGERNVSITPGTRISALPRHTLKLSADWRALPGFTLGGDMQVLSRRGSSGNEDGRVEDDASETVDLSLPGYALFNLRASYRPGAPDATGWELFAKINNLFDRRYETFGALASTVFSASGLFTGDATPALFVAPGAQRGAFIGLRYRY
jgi:outer membrane receptor protein involved in Fe transport